MRIFNPNCTAQEAERVLLVTNDGANTLFETSVACIGNSICQVGVRDSQALLVSFILSVPFFVYSGIVTVKSNFSSSKTFASFS